MRPTSFDMLRRLALATLVSCGSLLVPSDVAGQTAQRLSLQLSGLGSAPYGGGLAGIALGAGFEGQIRYNHSAFSIGFGFDATFHDVEATPDTTVTLAGGFVEPRYVIDLGHDRVAPYISARGAVSQTKVDVGTATGTATGFTLNGGGGILVVMGERANIDLGATLGFKDVGTADFPDGTFDLGSGANLIFRLGVAFGLGG